MKTILVDAMNTFVSKEDGICNAMYEILEEYPNKKIILTNANDEEMRIFRLNDMPYEVFTLRHDPEKINPEYFKKMFCALNLSPDNILYFEHNEEAVKSARSVGIDTFYYDKDTRDLKSLKVFIDEKL